MIGSSEKATDSTKVLKFQEMDLNERLCVNRRQDINYIQPLESYFSLFGLLTQESVERILKRVVLSYRPPMTGFINIGDGCWKQFVLKDL